MLTGRRADEVIMSFIGAINDDDTHWASLDGGCEQEATAIDDGDASDVEFWNSLESNGGDRLQSIPSVPEKFSRGSRNPSRISRLMGSSSGVGVGCKDCRVSMECRCSRPAMQ